MIPEPLRVTSIADAATRRSSFNLIHIATAFKADVFVPRPSAFDDVEMERRQSHVIDEVALMNGGHGIISEQIRGTTDDSKVMSEVCDHVIALNAPKIAPSASPSQPPLAVFNQVWHALSLGR